MAAVFISHRTHDSDAAERLAVELRQAGHSVWLDIWTIRIGDSLVQQINEGLQGATHVIVAYSTQDITSPWMSREWMSSLARHLEGYKVKLLPIILSGPATPPPILADLRYANLVSDWHTGVAEILLALK